MPKPTYEQLAEQNDVLISTLAAVRESMDEIISFIDDIAEKIED